MNFELQQLSLSLPAYKLKYLIIYASINYLILDRL
jgi:hypothetical protein